MCYKALLLLEYLCKQGPLVRLPLLAFQPHTPQSCIVHGVHLTDHAPSSIS